MTLPGDAAAVIVCVTVADVAAAVEDWDGVLVERDAGGDVFGAGELDTGARACDGWLAGRGALAPGLARSRMA